jgi:hypothetical protein
MTKRDKLKQKLHNNPKNITKQDFETLLLGLLPALTVFSLADQ